MFYDLFLKLCEYKGVAPTTAALEMGFSKATPTKWKNSGATPSGKSLRTIAAYFGVTESYLLNEKTPATDSDGLDSRYSTVIFGKDKRLLEWFRSLPEEKQKAILISQDAPEDLL